MRHGAEGSSWGSLSLPIKELRKILSAMSSRGEISITGTDRLSSLKQNNNNKQTKKWLLVGVMKLMCNIDTQRKRPSLQSRARIWEAEEPSLFLRAGLFKFLKGLPPLV